MTGAKVMEITPGSKVMSPHAGTVWQTARLVADGRPCAAHGQQRGVFAFHSARIAADYRDNNGQAIVIVRPEGESVIGERGWTAEAAEIVRIFVPLALYADNARALYDHYRVPVDPMPPSLRRRIYRHEARHWHANMPAAERWLRLHRPDYTLLRSFGGKLWIRRPAERAGVPARMLRAGPVALYDAQFAAQSKALGELQAAREKREREDRWARERAEQEAKHRLARARELQDQAEALEILRDHLPIRTVRVSSAQAQGRAKQYAYWGAVRYQIRVTSDGKGVSNMPLERASSDRRSHALAHRDADKIAAFEGRLYCHHIGRLTASQARELLARLVVGTATESRADMSAVIGRSRRVWEDRER